MKSDRTEMFNRIQDTFAQFVTASEQLNDTRASGSQLQHLAATAEEFAKAQDMLAHIMTSKFWD